MNTHALRLLLLTVAPLLSNCAMTKSAAVDTAKTAPVALKGGKIVAADLATDELDDYDTVRVSDPLEGFNRATFKLNDVMYTVFFRPVSKGYEFVFPKPVRKSIDNVFENAKYPVRFVNSALQGKFKRAGRETGKFFVNTIFGVGGLFKTSDKIPDLVDVPAEDTGQTLGTWGIGHGPYIVLPFLGPCTLRETVGVAGDYVLNPVNWGLFWHGGHDWEHDWTSIPTSANTLRALPDQLAKYDATVENSVDPYLSARSTYVQNRDAAAKK